jgi:hypothetical protein
MENIEIKWHAVGDVCKMYALAYGVAFLALAILNGSPEFKHIAQTSPWIPRYIGDLLAFVVTMVMIWRASQGRLGNYGFTIAGRNLKFSIALGTVFALIWILLDYSLGAVAGHVETQPTYPRTVTDAVGIAGYVYQETRSLAGPIMMHNIVDGLIHTVALLA